MVTHPIGSSDMELINIVCDRALVTAYSLGKKRVTGAVASVAIGELSGTKRAGYAYQAKLYASCA